MKWHPGARTSEFLALMLVFAIVLAFGAGAFVLCWFKRDYAAYMTFGSVVPAAVTLAHWGYNSGRVRLKDRAEGRE